jgi:hypothetical protein
MDSFGYEQPDFYWRQNELEEEEQKESTERDMDDFFFKGIVDTRVKSKARRKALFKIYFGDRNGTTDNFGDC